MAKIKVIVSMDIKARATCVVEVEEKIKGSHASLEDRAKDHVIACLAIGADVPWKIEHGEIAGAKNRYELDAEREPSEFDEIMTPAPARLVPGFVSLAIGRRGVPFEAAPEPTSGDAA